MIFLFENLFSKLNLDKKKFKPSFEFSSFTLTPAII